MIKSSHRKITSLIMYIVGKANRLREPRQKVAETKIRAVTLEKGKKERQIRQRETGKLRKYLSIGNGKDKVTVWHLGN